MYELADKNPTTENLNRLTQALFGKDADLATAQESYNLSEALSQGIPLENGTVLTTETLAQLVISQSTGLSDTFDANLSSQGAFSRGINWVNNNFTGFGTTQRMTEAQLDTYNNLTESLQNCSDPVEFAAIFKEATGQDLSYDSINQLLGGVSVVDNSHAAESMMDYENTQDSLKTATTAIATGIVVAATGGAALPAVAAGAAINVGVNAFDAATQNNGQSAVENLAVYAREDLVTDALVGGINGGTALIGSALGQKFTTGITAHIGNAAGSKAATLGVKTAGNFIDGAVDGGLSSGAEYIVGQIKNGESVNLSTLADVTIIGGVAGGAMSAVAGTFSKGNTAKTETTPDTGKPSSLLSDGADAPKMVSDVRGNVGKIETTSDTGKPSSLLSNGTDAPKTVSEGRGNAASGQDSPKLNGDTSKSLSEGKIDTGSKPDVDTPKTKPDTHVDADNRKPKNSGSSSNTDNVQYKTDTAKSTPSNALGKNTSSEATTVKSDVDYIQSNDSIVKNPSSNTSIKTDSVTQRVKSPDNNSIPESKPSSISNSTNLDKYKVDRSKQYLSEKEFSKKHEQFFIDENGNFVVNKDSKYQISGSSTWYSSKSGKNNNHTAWKMHIYSDNIKDFQDIMDVVSPYLSDNNIRHKILNTDVGFDKLNSGVQKGKSITIYPSSVSEMERVSCDLDYIIRNNNLEINGSNIIGDNMMGDTGRLFYRYEFKSGKYQDMSLDLNERLTPEMADKYGFDKNLVGTNLQDVYEKNLYDANRGENNYLASDMTVDDDIWLDFDPTTGKRTGVPYKTDAVNSTYSDISVPKSNAEEIPLKSDVQRIEAGKTVTVKSEDSVNSSNTTDSVVNSNHYVNPSDGQIFEIYGKRISNLKGKNYIEVDGKWKEVPDLNFNTNQLAQIQNINTRVNSLDLDAYNKSITDYSTTQGVLNKFDEAYKELRIQRYSEADTFGSEAARRSLDLKVKSADNGISRFEYMQNYWSARHNVNMDVRNINIIDRFSLNVRGNSELISELDRLMRDGVYVDTNGNTVKINIKNMYGDFYYKTPSETKDWLIRQDPVTVYCNGYASEELTEALTVISSRYQRGALNAAEPGSKTPWIQKEKSPSDSDIRALIDTAYKNYGEKVGNAVNSYFIKPDGSYIGSSGMVIAVKNTFNKIDQLKEFELYLNNDIQYRDAFNSAITKQIDIDSPKQISSGSDTPATKTDDYTEVKIDLNSSSKSKDLNKTDLKYIVFGGTAATAGAITAILNSTNRKEIVGDKNNIIEEDILPIQDEKPESLLQQESNSPTITPSSGIISSSPSTDNNVKDATPSETEIPSYSPVSSEVDIQKNLNINSSINIINQNVTDKIDFTKDINYNELLSDSNLNFSNSKLYSTSIDKNLVAAINNKNENILITQENSLIFHSSKTNDFPSENIGDELLLNVIGSADLIRELDELMTTGKYTIEINGEKVSVELDELTNFKFSIIKDFEKWNYSYYPITLYFDGEVNEETFTAIEAIIMKYTRGETNEIKGLDIEDLDTTNPWITKIKNPSESQLIELVDKAADIDDDFMNNVLIQCGNYVGMTGLQYLRALNIIEQYDEYSMDLV